MHDDDIDDVPELPNKRLLKVVMQEIVDMRLELKGDIAELRKELKGDSTGLKGEIGGLRTEMRQMNEKMDRNFVAIMANIELHDRRLCLLEAR